MAVWMDCTQDNVPVPTWRNTIVAKVTRVGLEEDDDDDDSDFVSGTGDHATAHQSHHHQSAPAPAPPARAAPAPAPAPPQQPAQRTQQPAHHEPFLDVFGGPSPTSSGGGLPTSAPPSTGNLLDTHHAPAPASGGLLDMDAPVYGNHHGSSNNAHSDFLGMTAPPVTPHGNQAAGGYNPHGAAGATHAQPYGQQPQTQQRPPQAAPLSGQRPNNQNAFNSFSDQQGPFGGLGTPWK